MTPTSASEALARPHNVTEGRQFTQSGFTLLELLLVLGILGMAAGLLVPRLTSLDGPGFTAQTREATGMLNYARRMAVVQGTPASVVLMTDDYADQLAQESQDHTSNAVATWIGRDITLQHLGSTGQRRQIEEQLQVTFYPEGGSTGGEITLRQDRREATIVVDPFSGRVQVRNEN